MNTFKVGLLLTALTLLFVLLGGWLGGTTGMVLALAFALVAPLAATLIQLAVSRAREFEADASAAAYTGSAQGLIGALRKLERGVERIPSPTARPATAHMSIVNPLAGGTMSGFAWLFSTHPPMDDRIAALHTASPRRASRRRPVPTGGMA